MALLLCALMAVFCACAKNEGLAAAVSAQYKDFLQAGVHKAGGVPMEQANARSLTAAREGGELKLTLSFVNGSRISGSADEKALLSPPLYDVVLLPSPARLVIEMPGLAYWDYTRTLDFRDMPEIQGSFQHILTDGDTVSLYIQLRRECAFRVEEQDGELIIHLHEIETEQTQQPEEDVADILEAGTRYYVMADAYGDYCSGAISREMDMLPTLCADRERIVLISRPFATPMAAQSYMEETLALTKNAIPAQWSTIELLDGMLPQYSEEMNYRAAHEQNVVRIHGTVLSAPVFLEDGLYLATLPEKNGVLYSKRMQSRESGGDEYTYELLYTMDQSGGKKRLFPYEFETVEAVKYSPDGRKMAVLERAAESTHLYVFDIAAKEILVDLTEIGFGDMISAFTWDELGSTIYAVSGTDNMQVHQYDFTVPDEAKRHSLADKGGADEGSIAYLDGEVYFAQTDLTTGAVIYSIKPDGGVRKKFAAGSTFELSPNGMLMAVNAGSEDFTVDSSAQSRLKGLYILDMQTGAQTAVNDAFSAYEFFWSREGGVLYYFENRLSGGVGEDESAGDAMADDMAADAADDYPYTLWAYDLATGENTALMDLPMTSLYMSELRDEFYLCYTDAMTMGDAIRATYALAAE